MKAVTVEAPSSSANLGSGFDVFAVALRNPSDRLTVSCIREGRSRISLEVPEGLGIPGETKKNVASVVAEEMCRRYGISAELKIVIERKVPVGLGLGSSAASAVAAAVAINTLFGLRLSHEELLIHAGKGESAASGSVHYDNVSASLYGGFVIVRPAPSPSPVSLGPPRPLRLCIATPVVNLPERKTEYARSMLPGTVELRTMTRMTARASTLVAGILLGDFALIGEGMDDEVVEPVRKKYIPGYEEVRKAARASGASGVCISGAGPSMLAVVDSRKSRAERVLDSMLSAFGRAGVRASGFVTRAGEGARVVSSS